MESIDIQTILLIHSYCQKVIGSGGIRTHAPEETGALNQRLRPLGHATSYWKSWQFQSKIAIHYHFQTKRLRRGSNPRSSAY